MKKEWKFVMKKQIALIGVIIILCFVAGCGAKENNIQEDTAIETEIFNDML